MKIAAAYIRVSDERQDEYSPDSQLKLIRDFAKKNNTYVPDEYVFFDDGISAKSSKKRIEFNRMIAMAKEKDTPFKTIYVWKFSRFARNQEESIVFKSLLRKNHVDVVSISEPVVDGVFGSLIERIIEWMDEYYLIRLSGEVKRGMTEKAGRGEPMCHPALGYKLIDKQYYPDESEAPIIRQIFSDYANGKGLREIATQLGNQGVRTHRGNPPDNRLIDYILHNPVYIGKIRWSTDGKAASKRDYDNENILITDGSHEPLIDMDLWNKVQERLKMQKNMYGNRQRKDQPVDWMLKGLVRCSCCGATLIRSQTACPSMQCHNYARGSCKTSHSLSIKKANKAVITALEQAAENMQFNFAPKIDNKKEPQIDYDSLIAKENEKLNRCKEAYRNGVDSLDEYAKNKKDILDNIEYLRNKKDTEINPTNQADRSAYADRVMNIVRLITDPTISEKAKNEALRTIISHIIYDKANSKLAIYFYA